MTQTRIITELAITCCVPPQCLQPNLKAKHHRYKISEATAKTRAEARVSAYDAMNRAGFSVAPKWPAATLHVTIYKPGNYTKPLDADNAIGWLKSTVDGIQDAGLIANDSGLTWLMPTQVCGPMAGERRVVLRFTKAP